MSPLVDALRPLALWIATHAVHSTLLLLLALLVAARLRSAALRGLVWRVALVGGLLTATVGGRLGSEWTRLDVGRVAPAAGVASAGGAPLTLEVARDAGLDRGEPAADAGPRPAAGVELAATAPEAPARWPLVVALAWLACAGFGATRWWRARRDLAALAARRRPLEDARVRARLDRVLARSGWRGPVTLSVVDGLPSPVALGEREIVLPTEATTFPDAALDALLAHECAHLARRDPRWLSLALLLEGVFPYLPLHRLARRRLTAEAELASDAWAARTTGEPLQLARCLADVADRLGARPLPATVSAMARPGSELVRRVEALASGAPLDPTPRQLRAFTGGAVLALVAFACGAPSLEEGASRSVETGAGTAEESGAVDLTVSLEERPAEQSPAEEGIAVVTIDRDGRARLEHDGATSERPIDLGSDRGLKQLRAELYAISQAMPRESYGRLSLPSGELRIVVEEGTRYSFVQKVMQECGARDVEIWNLSLTGAASGGETFAVPLPFDVHVQGAEQPQTVEIRMRAKDGAAGHEVRYSTRLAAAGPVEEPEEDLADDFFVGGPAFRSVDGLGELEARLLEAYAADPEQSVTIDARPGIVYGDVVAVLDLVVGVGFEQIVFVGSYE